MFNQINNIFRIIFYKNLLINFYIFISINFFLIYFYQQIKWYIGIFVLLISALSVYLFNNQKREYRSVKIEFDYKHWIILLILFLSFLNFFFSFDVKDLLTLFLTISVSFFSYHIYKYQIDIFIYINFVFFFITLLSVLTYMLSFDMSLAGHPLRISYLYTLFGHEVVSRAKGIFWSAQYYTLFVSIYLLIIIFGYGFKNFFLKYSSLILCIFSIYISETRTSMYSLFIVCIFLGLVVNFKKLKFNDYCLDIKILYTSTLSLFFIVILTILPIFVFNLNIEQFSSGRIQIWKQEVLKMEDNFKNYTFAKQQEMQQNLIITEKKIEKFQVPHSHNIFLDFFNGFYNPIYLILYIYLIFCIFLSFVKKDLFLFTFISFVLIASFNDLVWRIDRPDLITVLLIFLCLIQERKKITSPSV